MLQGELGLIGSYLHKKKLMHNSSNHGDERTLNSKVQTKKYLERQIA